MTIDNSERTTQKYSPKKTDYEEKVFRLLTTDSFSQPQIRKKLTLKKQTVFDIVNRLEINKIIEVDPSYANKKRNKKYRAVKTTETQLNEIKEILGTKQKKEGLTKEQIALCREAFQHRLRSTEKIGIETMRYIGSWQLNTRFKLFAKKPNSFIWTKGEAKEEEFYAMTLADFCEKYRIDMDKMKDKVRLRTGYRKDDEYFEDRFAKFLANLKVIDSSEYVDSQIRKIMKEENMDVFQAFMTFNQKKA